MDATETRAPARRAPENFEGFYRAAYPRVVAALLRVAGSREQAEELAQEAFARLVPRWERIGRFDDPEAWVRSVAFRLATSHWRRRRTQLAHAVRDRATADVPPPGDAAMEVDRLLAQLSVEHRAVLVLHHGLDLSVEQVARELHLPVGTVKSRLSRARAAALRAYEGAGR